MNLKIVRISDSGAIVLSTIGISPKAAYKQYPEEFRRLYDEMTQVLEKEKQLKLDDYVTFL